MTDIDAELNFEFTEEWRAAFDSIPALLARIPGLIDAALPFEPVIPASGSMLASDDAALGVYAASQLVGTCISAAIDCLDAIHTLMVEEDGGTHLHTFAQYPLLRTVLEASAQALWVLGPDGQQERIIRNLRLRATEFKHDAALAEPFIGKKSFPDALAPYKNKQVEYSTVVQQGLSGLGAEDAGKAALSAWRLMSGFTHAYSGRFAMFSTHIPVDASTRVGVSAAAIADGRPLDLAMANPQIIAGTLQTVLDTFEVMIHMVGKRVASV